MGTGYDGDNDKKDFWKYDPVADEWTELVGFGGNKRRDATYFRIEDKVYFGTGETNGQYLTDFWAFDLTSEKWIPLLDLDEEDDYFIARSNSVGFNIGTYGYLATGKGGIGVWEYDPSRDYWEEKTAFEGVAREGAVGFYNGGKAFVSTGKSGTLYLDDTLEFFPFQEEDEDD